MSPSEGRPVDYRSYYEEEISAEGAKKRIEELTFDVRIRLIRMTDLILSHPAGLVPQRSDNQVAIHAERVIRTHGNFNMLEDSSPTSRMNVS